MCFDALDAAGIFWDEIAQRRETGYDIDHVLAVTTAAELDRRHR